MPKRLLGAVCAMGVATFASAADFDVSNPADFQAALTAAQSNGQNDTINVLPCAGPGCTGNVYNITSTLTYEPGGSEPFSLTISGVDSDTRILDGGGAVQIMRIDTSSTPDNFSELSVQELTFQNGRASGGMNVNGGALAIVAGTERVEVRGSVFLNNIAEGNGGAAYLTIDGFGEAPLVLVDSTFSQNQALGMVENTLGDGGGALIEVPGFVAVDVFDTEFLNNTAQTDGGGLAVRGPDPMLNPYAGFTVLFETYFENNQALAGGGGGALLMAGGLSLSDSGFVDNEASDSGGGAYMAGFASLGMTNTGFAFNEAGGDGGGFVADGGGGFGSSLLMVNNTVYRNMATSAGGGAFVSIGGSTGLLRIFNNIIHSNMGEVGADIYIDNDPFSDIPAFVEFSNNDITSLAGFPDASDSFFLLSTVELSAGNNIDGVPILPNIEAPEYDPSQGLGSPTIDAGDDNAFGRPFNDFEGTVRPLDGDGDGIAVTDIGMDEFFLDPTLDADLTVSAVATPDPVASGGELTYTITVSNEGPDPATGVVLTETLDRDLTLISATLPGGVPCPAPLNVECAIGDLAVDDDVVITIVSRAPVVMEVEDLFSVASVLGNERDPDPNNNAVGSTGQVVPTAVPMADLAVSISDNPDPVFVDSGPLTYVVTVDNNGPDTATAVTMEVNLSPDLVTFESASASAGSCGAPDGRGSLVCNLNDLPLNNNATVTVVVTPLAMEGPVNATVTAAVQAAEEDPNTDNNAVSEQTLINPPSADLTVSTVASPAELLINEEVTFIVTASNIGPSVARRVVLTIDLPANAEFLSFAAGEVGCELGDGTLFCELGDLGANEGASVDVVFLAPQAAALLELEASVSSEVSDPDTANNSDNTEANVIEVLPVEIEALVFEGVGGGGALGGLDLVLLLLALGFTIRAWARSSAEPQTASGNAPGVARSPLLSVAVAGLTTVALLGTLAAGTAHADDRDFYFGASVGQSNAGYGETDLVSDLDMAGWTITNPSVDDTDLAWKLYGGYSFNRFFAVEAAWVDLGEVQTRFGAELPLDQIEAILNDTVAIHPTLGSGASLAAVFRYEVVPESLAFHARAGVFVWNADIDVEVVSGATGQASDDEDGTDFMYGVGLEWRLNRNLSITGDWERYRMRDWVDVPTVGFRYRFGGN